MITFNVRDDNMICVGLVEMNVISSTSPWTMVNDAIPSLVLADTTTTLVPSSTTTTTFEPILPDTTTLVGFGVLLLLCLASASVWNNSVVPISRTKLAISKSRGQVREYLDELSQSASDGDENEVEEDSSVEQHDETEAAATSTPKYNNKDRKFERWLFADWLNNKKSKKAPAIPILKDAKWNSGDNPVVVTVAIMMIGIIVASITERVVG
jgi:hypothetical protein